MIAYAGGEAVGRIRIFENPSDSGQSKNPIAFIDRGIPSLEMAVEWEPMNNLMVLPDDIQTLVRNKFVIELMDDGWRKSDKTQIHINKDLSIVRDGVEPSNLRDSESWVIPSSDIRVAGENIALSALVGDIFGSRKLTAEVKKNAGKNGSESVVISWSEAKKEDEDEDEDEKKNYLKASLGFNVLELFGNNRFLKFGLSAEEIASRIKLIIEREGGCDQAKLSALRSVFEVLAIDWVTLGRAGFDATHFSLGYVIDGPRSGYVFNKINKKDFMGSPHRVLHGVQSSSPFYVRDFPWDEPNSMPVSINGKDSAHNILVSDFVKFGVESGAFADEDSAKNGIAAILVEVRVRVESMILDNLLANHTGTMKSVSEAADNFCKETAQFIGHAVKDSPDIANYCKFQMENRFYEILSKHAASRNMSDEIVIAFNNSVSAVCSDLGFDLADLRLTGNSSMTGKIMRSISLFSELHKLICRMEFQSHHGKSDEIQISLKDDEILDFFKLAKKHASIDKSFKGWHLDGVFTRELCMDVVSNMVAMVSKTEENLKKLEIVANKLKKSFSEAGISWEPGRNPDGACYEHYSFHASPLMYIASIVNLGLSDIDKKPEQLEEVREREINFIVDSAKLCLSIFVDNGFDVSADIEGLPPRDAIISFAIKHKSNDEIDKVLNDEQIADRYNFILDKILPAKREKTLAIR